MREGSGGGCRGGAIWPACSSSFLFARRSMYAGFVGFGIGCELVWRRRSRNCAADRTGVSFVLRFLYDVMDSWKVFG